jgi:hypothetical protein
VSPWRRVGAFEDAEDYKAFEAAVTADYDAQSAVERELVLRFASLLWRLRRATTMETGLFETQAGHLRHYRQNRQALTDSHEVIHAVFRRADSASAVHNAVSVPHSKMKADVPTVESPTVFCVWLICPISPLIGLAAMKQAFGGKPAGSCLHSMPWIGANPKSVGAVSG